MAIAVRGPEEAEMLAAATKVFQVIATLSPDARAACVRELMAATEMYEKDHDPDPLTEAVLGWYYTAMLQRQPEHADAMKRIEDRHAAELRKERIHSDGRVLRRPPTA